MRTQPAKALVAAPRLQGLPSVSGDACREAIRRKQSGDKDWLLSLAGARLKIAHADTMLRVLAPDGLALSMESALVAAELLVTVASDYTRALPYAYWFEQVPMSEACAAVMLTAAERICERGSFPGIWARVLSLCADLGHSKAPAWAERYVSQVDAAELFDVPCEWLPAAMTLLSPQRARKLLLALWACAPFDARDALCQASLVLLNRLDARAAWRLFDRMEGDLLAQGRPALRWAIAHARRSDVLHPLVMRYARGRDAAYREAALILLEYRRHSAFVQLVPHLSEAAQRPVLEACVRWKAPDDVMAAVLA